VDYYGEPKQAFYFIARAYEDFHISAQYEKILWRPGEKFRAEVWLHNDTLTEPANCRVDLALRLLNGRTLWASQCSTPLLRDASFLLTTVEWDVTSEIEDQVFVLDLRVTAADGTLLSSNPYCFGTSMPVLQPMLAAPKARLTTEQTPLKLQLKPGEEITCALPFTNDAKAYALVVHCKLELDGSSDLFHTYFQDNDRIAFGGEACCYQLGLRAAENTAPGRYQGHFVLAGWNTAQIKIPVSIELVKEQSL
jgi:beta-mannosidase